MIVYAFAALFVVAGLFVAFRGLGLATAARERRSWPGVDATITAAELLTWEEQDRDTMHGTIRMHGLELRYTYTTPVAGPYRSGATHEARVTLGASRNAATWEMKLRNYPVGSTIRAFYDPARPDSSTLDPARDLAGALVLFAFGLAFAGMAILFAFVASRM